ncbi:MAG: T9SS type A sorting domain-containing protein [Prolixibacteraceae bacterium]
MKKLKLIFALIVAITTLANAQPLAFPGAEGYGRVATGGRGTLVDGRTIFLNAKVVEVTNLEDYDEGEEAIAGSFRWALSQQDTTYNGLSLKIPSTIVFRVGGVIELKRDVHTAIKHMTIAGQTAPGDGICFRGATLNFSGSENVIVRYIRSRPGDELGLETSAFRIENGRDFMIDHCSFSWAIEETTHFSSSPNFTIQWCIISESLYNSFHKKGERGYGTQWGGEYASYHHNLLAHHNSRMPRINGSNENDVEALVDYRNNVNYNWGHVGSFYGGEWMKTGGKGFAHTNVVNCYFVPGPATPSTLTFARPNRGDTSFPGYSKWYFNGNYMLGSTAITNDNWLGVDGSYVGVKDSIRSDVEFVQTDGVLEQYDRYTQTASDAYQSVLKNVGAALPKRDAHDTRLIQEMTGEIEVLRYQYTDDSGQVSPIKGVNAGLIDTQMNLVSPEDRATGKDAWSVYQSSTPDQAIVDTDHDGMPDEWETAHQLNPSDGKDFRTITPSGYTYLEVYLAELVGDTIDYNVAIQNAVDEYNRSGSILAFPNPCENELNIAGTSQIIAVELLDFSGRKVLELRNNDGITKVSVSQLKSGYYILRSQDINGQVQLSKVIKQ